MIDIIRRIVLLLAFLEAGFMTFNGTRALMYGDYIRPSRGEEAGQLGPWTEVVGTVGIDPESTAMKIIFISYGLVWLGVIAANVVNETWGRTALLVLAIGSLWYMWIGSIFSAIQVILLLQWRRLDLRGY